jgi:hypothetical protein
MRAASRATPRRAKPKLTDKRHRTRVDKLLIALWTSDPYDFLATKGCSTKDIIRGRLYHLKCSSTGGPKTRRHTKQTTAH